ncbi:MAG: DUF2270 domain-containing protein [Acidobacteriota bacterium]|jgi:uncharacterized membrane protein
MDPEPKRNIFEKSDYAALVHYYRGEVQKVNTWRRRLDVTTNWAIVTSAGFLSFGFGNKEATHFVIVLATIIVTCFLIIEARRYKYYDLWRWRVDLLNENFFALILSKNKSPLIHNWFEQLATDLQHPQFKISSWEAIGKRIRRNYSWLYGVLALCWITKVLIHPVPSETFVGILDRAAIYHLVPGWLVIIAGIIFNSALIVIAVSTRKNSLKL